MKQRKPFHFKQFSIEQDTAPHAVGTDAVLLGAWADTHGVSRFLDIGTGTGILALMLAQRLETPDWSGDALEIHPEAAANARLNVAASRWAAQITVHTSSLQLFAANFEGPAYDLIVSNPPYFSGDMRASDTGRDLGRNTEALPFAVLAAAARKLLHPNGRFCVVLPEQEGRQLSELAVGEGLYWTRITEVRACTHKPVERLLLQFERNPFPLSCERICIYGAGTAYTPEYAALTAAFYL